MSETQPPVGVDSQEPPIYYYASLGRATDGRLFPIDIFVDDDEARDCKKKDNTIVANDGASACDNLLDLPANLSAEREMWFDDTDSCEREPGLAEVARLNHECQPGERRFLVELGQPLPMPFGLIEVGQGGAGFAEMRYTYPICVVRPTAAERARFGA
jgi:hypothetical protein